MATINQLSSSDEIQTGDQAPIWSAANGDTRRVNYGQIRDFALTPLASDGDGEGAGLVTFSQDAEYDAGTVGYKLQNIVNLDDFSGANDFVKMTAAVAHCSETGTILSIPARRINIDSDLGSITLENVSVMGPNVLDGDTTNFDKGGIFWITGTTNSPFKIRRGVTIEGCGFFYPDQVDSATPIVYPVLFDFDVSNGAVQFVNINRNVIYNAYRVVDFTSAGGAIGHVEIQGNYICGLNRGIYIRHNAEHIRIKGNNFTFGFWLQATEGGAAGYMRANATNIQADQSDGLEITDNLFFGSLNGVLTSASGLCQFMNISLNKFDQVRYGVKGSGAGRFDGSINGNTFNSYNSQATALQGRSIDIQTTGAGTESITITGNNFDAASEQVIYIAGNTPARYVVIGPNNYRGWAAFKAAGLYGAIDVSGTNTSLIVTGSWFQGGTYQQGIVGSPNTFQATGNTFNFCANAVGVTTNSAVLAGNVSFNTGGATSDVLVATSIWEFGNAWDKPAYKTPIYAPLAQWGNYANDAAAAAAGVPVGGFYRTGTAVQVRAV